MFRALFGGRKKLVYDPALGDPLARKIIDETRGGTMKGSLRALEKFRQGKWDQRGFYAWVAGESLARNADFPDTAVGNLVRGAYLINQAWLARGGGTADTVSGQGWVHFRDYLNGAYDCLIRSAEQDPEDPTPFAFLQPVAMGLQLDREAAQILLNEATTRDPANQQAHYRHLFLLCQKWGGSHKEMYAFARATMDRIPADSTLNSILFVAFQEHYLYLRNFDKDPEGAQALLQDERIRADSVKVYQQSLGARREVAHVADYWPHNVAMWWFHLLGEKKIVRREGKKIGDNFTEFPWALFYRDPAAAFDEIRRS